MGNSIMVTGPHAIGKTTTAKEIADLTGRLFIGSIAALVAKRLNFDFDTNTSPVDRAKYQFEILKGSEFIYEATALVPTIHDRSPLDFAAYLALSLIDHSQYDNIVKEYVHMCVQYTNDYCDVLVIPETDLTEPYEDKDGRPRFTDEQITYRERYAKVLNIMVDRLSSTVKVIRVPKDKQFGDRTKFILDQLK